MEKRDKKKAEKKGEKPQPRPRVWDNLPEGKEL